MFFWIHKNKANGKHFHDGRYWTYNSVQAFSVLFPYWSQSQIKRVLTKLETNGVIHSGNFNTTAQNRTKWYSLSDEAWNVFMGGECDNGEQKPPRQLVPAEKTDTTSDIVAQACLPFEVEQAVIKWLQYKKERRQNYTPSGLKTFLDRVRHYASNNLAADIEEVIENSIANNYQGVTWDRLKSKAGNGAGNNLFAKRAMEMEGT